MLSPEQNKTLICWNMYFQCTLIRNYKQYSKKIGVNTSSKYLVHITNNSRRMPFKSTNN